MEIKEYDSNFFDSFVYLIDNCFWIKNNDKNKLIKWKFFDNPNNEKNKIVCSYYEDKIVWQYSNISTSFIYQENIINWYICQDMCVLKDFRWKWLISKMSSKLYFDVLESTFSIWFSNEQWVKVDKNSKWYWYNVIGKLTSYILPTFLNFNKTYFYKKIENINDLKNINFNEFGYFSEYLKINSDFNYIKWRYFDKPNSNYSFFLIYDEKQKNIWYVVFYFKKWFWNIYDFNIIKETDIKRIIWTLKNIWIENKIFFLRIQILKNNFWKNFFKWFFKINKRENIYFTNKNHNIFNKIDILNKENWIIKTWDIL